MRRILATVAVSAAVLLGTAGAAHAGTPLGDGKPASHTAQKSACKGTTGTPAKDCKALAKLPDWWMPIGGVNYHRPNGATIIKTIRGGEPRNLWDGDFKRNIQEYNDNHAHIQLDK